MTATFGTEEKEKVAAGEEWTVVVNPYATTKGRSRGGGSGLCSGAGKLKNNNIVKQRRPVLQVEKQTNDDDATLDPTIVISQLNSCRQYLKESHFYQTFINTWYKIFLDNDNHHDDDENTTTTATANANALAVVKEIVCYGIGNFSQRCWLSTSTNYSAPLWQLALALELQQQLQRQQQVAVSSKLEQQSSSCCVNIIYFEPLITELERQILENEYGITVLSQNERGMREATTTKGSSSNQQYNENKYANRDDNSDNKNSNKTSTKTTNDTIEACSQASSSLSSSITFVTVFFMPHCPKGLYENVLWANWNALNQPQPPQQIKKNTICIIGNSLVTYVEREHSLSTTATATTTTRDRRIETISSTTGNNSCLELIQPYVTERLVPYTKRDVRDMPGYFEAAFNDTYVTTFGHNNNNKNDNSTTTTAVWLPDRPLHPSQDGQNEVL